MYDLEKGYALAKEYYAQYGIDIDKAIEICDKTPISMHCWQGDDVNGFEKKEGVLQAESRQPEIIRALQELRTSLEPILKRLWSLSPVSLR